MSELIINSKLATAGPGHFELQKYPPKRKLYEKIAVSGIRTWDQYNCDGTITVLPLNQGNKI